MKIQFDYIEKHTAKASLLVRGDVFAWLPNSTYKITDHSKCEAEVVEGFEIVWKNDEGKIVLKEGEVKVGSGVGNGIGQVSGGRLIQITENNRDELWEYI